MQVRLAALVGAGREALAQSFRDVQLAAVSAADLWRLACTGKFKAAAGARRAPPARPAQRAGRAQTPPPPTLGARARLPLRAQGGLVVAHARYAAPVVRGPGAPLAQLWRHASPGLPGSRSRAAHRSGVRAGERALVWLRGAAPRLLPDAAPLAEAGVPADAAAELAAALPRLRPLPSRSTCAVPDAASASISLRPPGAFTARPRAAPAARGSLQRGACGGAPASGARARRAMQHRAEAADTCPCPCPWERPCAAGAAERAGRRPAARRRRRT